MHFTRVRDLVLTGLVAAALVYLSVRVLYGQMPPLPTFAGITLLVLAVVEAAFGFALRSRIRNPKRTVQALTAARAVALAKASSILGAIMFGAWLAIFAYVFPRRGDITAAANDFPSTVIGVICSALLIGAALYLEWCCRTPHDQDDEPPEHNSGSSG